MVYGQVFLFIVAWLMALGRLVGERFWNSKRNVENLEALLVDNKMPKSMKFFLQKYVLSYFTTRFFVFFPHVVGAILWWNLYFLQLILSIRQKHRRFHRILGRVLMVCALCQTISGAGLAYMGSSSTINCLLCLGGFGDLLRLPSMVLCLHPKGYSQAQILVDATGWIPTNNHYPARCNGPVGRVSPNWFVWPVPSL